MILVAASAYVVLSLKVQLCRVHPDDLASAARDAGAGALLLGGAESVRIATRDSFSLAQMVHFDCLASLASDHL